MQNRNRAWALGFLAWGASAACTPSVHELGDAPGAEAGTGGNAAAGGDAAAGGNAGAVGDAGAGGNGAAAGGAGAGGNAGAPQVLPLPAVLSVTPGDGEADVETDAKIVITFAEDPAAALVSGDNIELFDGPKAVAGEFEQDGAQVTFTPDEPLALFAEYRLAVQAPTAADATEKFESRFSVREGEWDLTPVERDSLVADTVPLSAAGEVLLAWAQRSASKQCQASAQRFRFGEPLSQPVLLTPEPVPGCQVISVAANSASDAVVYWVEDGPPPAPAGDPTERGFVQVYRNGEWQAEKRLLTAPALTSPARTHMSEAGVAHVLQFGYGSGEGLPEGVLAWHTDAAGNWLGPEYLSESSAGTPPQVAFASGAGIAAWAASDRDLDRDYSVEVADFDATADRWGQAQTLPGSTSQLGGGSRGMPGLALDGAGDPLVVWVARELRGASLVSSRRRGGIEEPFGEPQVISNDVAGVDMNQRPVLVFDGRDFVAAWAGGGEEQRLYSSRYDVSTDAWGEAILLNDGVAGTSLRLSPRLVSDPRGNLLVVFPELNGSRLAYRRYSAASRAWGAIQSLPAPQVPLDAFNVKVIGPAALSMNQLGQAALLWGVQWSTLTEEEDEVTDRAPWLASYY